MPTPQVIQKWPGRNREINNKVPTSISYWSEGVAKDDIKDWGFGAQHVYGAREWFKRYLDPACIERTRDTVRKSRGGTEPVGEREVPSHDEVKKWFRDYLRRLYSHISQEIQGKTGSWVGRRVEFFFSLPCTFQRQSITKSILDLIKEAGFGSEGDKHTVELGLSEPEAAAVFTIGQTAIDFKPGMTALVCDAGGGTTDLAVLRLVSKDDDPPELEALVIAEGKNVGSTNVDLAFESMVEKRLSTLKIPLPDNVAWCMMHSSDYLAWKCLLGQDDVADITDFPVPVPDVQEDFESVHASIVRGKMRFTP